MLQIASAVITAIGAIIVAAIELRSSKERKAAEARAAKDANDASERAKARAMESRLSMDMMYATSKLCVGTALAVKRGKANGELDEGLEMVDKATSQYENFLKDVVAGRITA